MREGKLRKPDTPIGLYRFAREILDLRKGHAHLVSSADERTNRDGGRCASKVQVRGYAVFVQAGTIGGKALVTRFQSELDYADSVADWFMELGDRSLLKDDQDETAKAWHVAASILSWQNRTLSSPELEQRLGELAARLPTGTGKTADRSKGASAKEVCLHVMSHALPAGGITSMVMRWIRSDPDRVHCLALLQQKHGVPEHIEKGILASGGQIYLADANDSLLQQAAWLRELSGAIATQVVLHANPDDVIYNIAFGIAGGPPVCLVNYTAHLFWAGGAAVDLVFNVRGSQLEQYWTHSLRGIARCANLPITLPEIDPASLPSSDPELRREARRHLGIPQDCTAIVTVGASFKYRPKHGLDFLATCESALKRLPHAVLLVVGFRGDERWQEVSSRLGNRIKTFGVVSPEEVAIVHQAADIYIEGFPFGTTTALLEAGAKDIPVVLAPAQCPPPYGSDGVALDDVVERPSSTQDYADRIVRLATDPELRRKEGTRSGASIRKHHSGKDWRNYLKAGFDSLPAVHTPFPLAEPVRTPQQINDYWSEFVVEISDGPVSTVEMAVARALSIGLKPRLTRRALAAFCSHFWVRAGRTIPLPLLFLFCNVLQPICPLPLARRSFQILSFLFRPHLARRLKAQIAEVVMKKQRRSGMYDEYFRASKAKGTSADASGGCRANAPGR